MKSLAHPFSKCAPEGKTVRHDGHTVFWKVRPWYFFCAICPMAQPKCIPVDCNKFYPLQFNWPFYKLISQLSECVFRFLPINKRFLERKVLRESLISCFPDMFYVPWMYCSKNNKINQYLTMTILNKIWVLFIKFMIPFILWILHLAFITEFQ